MRETVKIERCSICKSKKCDGKEYQVKGEFQFYGRNQVDKVVCSSSVRQGASGKWWHEIVCGHGISFWLEALPVGSETTINAPRGGEGEP
jgi:hypothetical protein